MITGCILVFSVRVSTKEPLENDDVAEAQSKDVLEHMQRAIEQVAKDFDCMAEIRA